MRFFLKSLQIIALLAVIGGAAWFSYDRLSPLWIVPCTEPLAYDIGTFDERFDITEAQLTGALAKAANVWNTAAGKVVVRVAAESDKEFITVNMAYGEEQKTAELGASIDADQAAYDRQKEKIEDLRNEYETERSAYESRAASFEARAAAYEAEVAKWNARGGAPQDKYLELQQEQRDLERDEERLNAQADDLNETAGRINAAVDSLNALAEKLNNRVDVFNMQAGKDFDQGTYTEDAAGKRITIREFESIPELTRVLTHEFGHALGIGHVENPDSVMYSYNIGSSLALSEEDIAALKTACRLD